MILAVVFLLFLLFLFLPFVPGLVELFKKTDSTPLHIAMDYIRNPRYFSKSFKSLLDQALEKTTGEPGLHSVWLSKKELLEICRSMDLPSEMEICHLLYIQGDLTSGDRVLLSKEVYATGDIVLGGNTVLQALASEKNITLGPKTECRRWVDALGHIQAGESCHLGINITAGGSLTLGKNCTFRRLFAMPVITGTGESPDPGNPFPDSGLSQSRKSGFRRIKNSHIQQDILLEGNVVFIRKVALGKSVRVLGDVKAYDDIVLEENVFIQGNLFSDGSITLGPGTRITGHVFSQKSIRIHRGTRIGSASGFKSVVGKKEVYMEPEVMIYGFISTEGKGVIL